MFHHLDLMPRPALDLCQDRQNGYRTHLCFIRTDRIIFRPHASLAAEHRPICLRNACALSGTSNWRRPIGPLACATLKLSHRRGHKVVGVTILHQLGTVLVATTTTALRTVSDGKSQRQLTEARVTTRWPRPQPHVQSQTLLPLSVDVKAGRPMEEDMGAYVSGFAPLLHPGQESELRP